MAKNKPQSAQKFLCALRHETKYICETYKLVTRDIPSVINMNTN
jgi:hypothetical protein